MVRQGIGPSGPDGWPDSDEEHRPPIPSPGRALTLREYRRSVLATAVWAGVNAVLILVVAGPPGSSRAAGAFVGGPLLPCVLGGC